MKKAPALAAVLAAAALLSSCSGDGPLRDRRSDAEAGACAAPGEVVQDCAVDGYPDRPMAVYVPGGYADEPVPVVIFLHGGGGNAQNAQATTCVNGDSADETCLQGVGDREGFITVYASGYRPSTSVDLRTWNAGGGITYACASGAACSDDSDDIAYVSAVIDQVEADYAVDDSRIYVIGFSNGAAMAHRVGCELSERVAGIVAVSGANEVGADGTCAPTVPVPVMHIHGTADACWSYEPSRLACADPDPLPKAGVAESTAAWLGALDCDATPVESSMPDTDAGDGTTTTVTTYGGCRGGVEVRILTVDGGGHIYPQGAKVRETQGRTDVASGDFGNEEIWEWLSQWSLARA